MNKLKVVAIGVIALVAVIVVLQNTQDVETKLLFVTLTLPNAALLFATLIIGFAIGVLTAGHIVSNAKRPLSQQPLPNSEPMTVQRAHPSSYPPSVDVRSDFQRVTPATEKL
jgi:lipopolysaccharide assembly protein A